MTCDRSLLVSHDYGHSPLPLHLTVRLPDAEALFDAELGGVQGRRPSLENAFDGLVRPSVVVKINTRAPGESVLLKVRPRRDRYGRLKDETAESESGLFG